MLLHFAMRGGRVNPAPRRPHFPVMAESRLHLWDLLQVLVVQAKVVVGITAGVVAARWVTGRGVLPRYEAKATIRVNSSRQPLTRLEAPTSLEDLSLRTDPVLSEALVLATQQLGVTVADMLGLRAQLLDPAVRRADVIYNVQVDSMAALDTFELRLKGARGWELHDNRGRTMTAGGYETPVVGPGFTFQVRSSPGASRALRMAVIGRDEAGNMVRGGLGYTIQPNTNLIDVSYTGGDASQVPAILNASMIALREYGVQRTRQAANNRLQYIQARSDEARQRYVASLAAMQAYKEQEHTSNLTAGETALINSIQAYDHERTRRQLDLAQIRGIMSSSQA